VSDVKVLREGEVIIIELGTFRVVSFKCDTELLKRMDDAVRRFGYKNRSELIREAVKMYLDLLDRYGRQAEKVVKYCLSRCGV